MLIHRLPLDRVRGQNASAAVSLPALAQAALMSFRPWIYTIMVIDILSVVLLAVTASGIMPASGAQGLARMAAIIAVSVAVWLLAAHQCGLYWDSAMAAFGGTLRPAITTAVLGFGLITLMLFAFGPNDRVIRLHLLVQAVATAAWVFTARAIWRACLRAAFRRGYCLDRPLILARSAAAARAAADALEDMAHGGIRAAACASLPGTPDSPPFAWIVDAVRNRLIDRILIVDGEHIADPCAAILPWLMALPVDVAFLPERWSAESPFADATILRAMPALRAAHRPLGAIAAACKRIEDLTIALVALIAALPLLVAISVAIRIDSPGPVLFRQPRVGRDGNIFAMWKFRTMYAHMADTACIRQTSRDDGRVTRVGRLLRRTSLDELPQLFNVMLGDMAIVGPRPHAVGMTIDELPLPALFEDYISRHSVKPGMTGWAQINGSRGAINTAEQLRTRIDLDLQYIDNWSLPLDLWIMLKTAFLLVHDSHAY